jgi:sec-independent protein translocase protein TatC
MPSSSAPNYSEDLFEESKMTFGQHLEELRSSLFKAVVSLFLGFLVGLYFGENIVHIIEYPLKQSLLKYYAERDVDKLREIIEQKREAGEDIPGDPDQLAIFMANHELTFDEMMIDGPALLEELKRTYPSEFKDWGQDAEEKTTPKTAESADARAAGEITTPEVTAPGEVNEKNLLRLFVWRKVKDTERARLTTLNAQEAFMIWIKAALIFGLILSSPLIFWFIWDFVRVGLYPHERKYINLFLPISLSLFLSGAALAFFVVFRYVLDFLFEFNKMLGLEPDMRISEWLSFALFMPVGFGVAFQLPLVMLFLDRIGVFNVEIYLQKWRIAILVIAIISMLLTPADPMSMMLMAMPLWVLYFAGIAFCKYLPRSSSPFAAPID